MPYRARLAARVGAVLIHLVKDGQQECSRLARTWDASKLHRLADVAAKIPASLVYRLCLVSFTLHFTNTNLTGSHKPYSFCHQVSHAAFFSKESDQSPITFWSSHGRTLQPTLPQTVCSFFLLHDPGCLVAASNHTLHNGTPVYANMNGILVALFLVMSFVQVWVWETLWIFKVVRWTHDRQMKINKNPTVSNGIRASSFRELNWKFCSVA